jgi:uncharacterized protein
MRRKRPFSLAAHFLTLLLTVEIVGSTTVSAGEPRFRALVLAEGGAQHGPFVDAAKKWLTKLASDSNFAVDYIHNPDSITTGFLARYRLFIQLDYPPYAWNDTAKAAFEEFITGGPHRGWIGFHHASLLGEFDGYPMWQWFSDFMGGIRWKNYIPAFASGTVQLEDNKHPVMKGLPTSFVIKSEEWYTYDKSPRPGVHVLASVNESTYAPSSDIRMGDHPVIWTNEHYKARNIYIFMGHHPDLFENPSFTTLFRNAIFWAAY